MKRVVHLLDASADWQVDTGLRQLRERLPNDRIQQGVLSLNCPPPGWTEAPVVTFPSYLPWLGAPVLRSALKAHHADVIHAWSVSAAFLASSCGTPLVISLFNPALTPRERKLVRTLCEHPHTAVACSSGTVRRRLIESGIPPERCALIRPGVDFGWLGRQQRAEVRRQLGLDPQDYAVLTAPCPRRGGGHMETAFAVELAGFLNPDIRVVLPNRSHEVQRIMRFMSVQMRPDMLRCAGDPLSYLTLLSAADVLVEASYGDTPTTHIAWAMAAGVPVIGVADYAVAELITHKVNGLLFKPEKGEGRAVTIARMLSQRSLHARYREAARGQAYEVFSLRRCVDQHARLYENVLAGEPADAGIADPAQVA